jgi:hypothetical protein
MITAKILLQRARNRASYHKHRAERLLAHAVWKAANKAHIKARNQEWYLENREWRLEYASRYYRTNCLEILTRRKMKKENLKCSETQTHTSNECKRSQPPTNTPK